MNSSTTFVVFLSQFVTTYLIHSTVLLSAAWLLTRKGRVKSHALRESIWKTAATLGIVTAAIQLFAAGPIAEVRAVVRSAWQGGAVSGLANHGASCSTSNDAGASVDEAVSASPAESLVTGELTAHSQFAAQTPASPSPQQGLVAEPSMPIPMEQAAAAEQQPREDASDASSFDSRSEAAAVASWSMADAAGLILLLPVATILAGLLLLTIQAARLVRPFPGSKTVESGPVRRILDRVLRKAGIKRKLRLRFSDECSEPLAYGLFQWTIILPTGIERHLKRDQLRALLAHEVAHLVRGDVAWLYVGKAICSCLAFQPLNFIARRQWQYAAEHLCDDWAVKEGNSALSLAHCLTAIVEWQLSDRVVAGALAARGSAGGVVERVQRLLGDPSRADGWAGLRGRWCSTLMTILIGAAIVCAGPRLAVGSAQLPEAMVPEAAPPLLVAPDAGADARVDSDGADHDPQRSAWLQVQQELNDLDGELERVLLLLRQWPRSDASQKLAAQLLKRRAALQRNRHTRRLRRAE